VYSNYKSPCIMKGCLCIVSPLHFAAYQIKLFVAGDRADYYQTALSLP